MKKVFFATLTLVAAAAMSIMAPQPVSAAYNRVAKVQWGSIQDAHHYNIYYRESGETRYDHAVRDLPANMSSYTIGQLKTDTAYVYRVAAVRADGTEFLWSAPKRLSSSSWAQWYAEVKSDEVVSKMYRQATVKWNGVTGAESYNVYYKKVGEAKWTHAVRDLGKDSRGVTIKYLDKVGYVYEVVAVRGDKTEFSWGGVKKLYPTTVMKVMVK